MCLPENAYVSTQLGETIIVQVKFDRPITHITNSLLVDKASMKASPHLAVNSLLETRMHLPLFEARMNDLLIGDRVLP
jgi:hypothetical protein